MDTAYTVVTEHTKDRLWEDMWDVARYVRYYEMQTHRLGLWNKGIRLLILVGGAMAVGSIVDPVPAWVGVLGGLLLFSLTAVDLIWDWGTKAALSHAVSLECSIIEKDYEKVWSATRAEQISDADCQSTIDQLGMRIIATTAMLSGTDKGLNRKAQEAATKVLADKWGGTIESTTRTAATA
jgi:hypothetical protein